jgi:SnoaL-like domain
MQSPETIVQRYIDTWNATDATRRRALVGETFTDDAVYTDPLASVSGHAGIEQLIAGAQAQFAGHQFSLASGVDAHHDQVRFTWQLGPEGADPPVVGFDVAVLEDGRIRAVYGFLDKVPG